MSKAAMVQLAQLQMDEWREKRQGQDPYLPHDFTKGRVYAWFDEVRQTFTFSKNPRKDYSEEGLRFVCEFFNTHKTNLHFYRNNAWVKVNPEDLSQCSHQVLY